MKAWFVRRYGGPEVLRLEEVQEPVPGPGDVLIRVHATTVSSADIRIRACNLPAGMGLLGRLAIGWSGPRQPIMGTELSGVVEAVGQGVTGFAAGDSVYAFPGGRQGAHAEYVVLPPKAPSPTCPTAWIFTRRPRSASAVRRRCISCARPGCNAARPSWS